MSIKPQFYEQISKGLKKVEYRTMPPKSCDRIYLYVSHPVKKIKGYIEVDKIITENPDKIWSITRNISGISLEYFKKYTEGKSKVSGILIEKFVSLDFDPYKNWMNFRAPQNFYYLEDAKLGDLVQTKRYRN
jgi:predicted transcriptional regulator